MGVFGCWLDGIVSIDDVRVEIFPWELGCGQKPLAFHHLFLENRATIIIDLSHLC